MLGIAIGVFFGMKGLAAVVIVCVLFVVYLCIIAIIYNADPVWWTGYKIEKLFNKEKEDA
jgi:hypothetical protein